MKKLDVPVFHTNSHASPLSKSPRCQFKQTKTPIMPCKFKPAVIVKGLDVKAAINYLYKLK